MMLALTMQVFGAQAQESVRETIRLDKGWKFAMGHAADPQKDFGCGTEYFNYLTKANSIHNEGPYVQKFDDAAWQEMGNNTALFQRGQPLTWLQNCRMEIPGDQRWVVS